MNLMKTLKILLIVLFLVILSTLSSSAYARSGCCSYHNGVCGNSCCDGSPLSAVCGGGYEPPTYTPTYTNFSRVNNYALYNDICYDFDTNKWWINNDYYSSLQEAVSKLPIPTPIVTPVPSKQLSDYSKLELFRALFGVYPN